MGQADYHLFGGLNGGSAIVEAMLTKANLPFTTTDFEWDDIYGSAEAILAVNPVGQIPALRLPDGVMLTESAAIALHLSDIAPEAGLAPPPGDPLRPVFLRWLTVLTGAIYPMFTFGDKPPHWVGEGVCAEALLASTEARKKELWAIVERDAPLGQWFLSERFSALDLFVAVMTHWRPGRDYFEAATPKLTAIVRRVDQLDSLKPAWARHFG